MGSVGQTNAESRRRFATLNEKPLHAALKAWYAGPEDRTEVHVDGSLVDIVRASDGLLVEIQTRNLAAIRRKLTRLLARHRVRLVHPVAIEKWIVRTDGEGAVLGRRKSPKRGRVEDAFTELVHVPRLLVHPNFSFEVVLIREEEVRRHQPGRVWRRKGWTTCERRLIEVVGRRAFETPAQLAGTLPDGLPDPFTTRDLAALLEIRLALAQKMTYCLREMDAISVSGKKGNAVLYSRLIG
ncbi:hypothetical protein JW916_11535 [Candidatus Sumerlaeota bacterium]|nr:hypothetical protein [Candidatus Sumerlaeota bacterium]